MKFTKDNVIGKVIFVSIVYLSHEGKPEERLQNCGTIFRADEESIEYKLLESEETFNIPAFYDNLDEADTGLVYKLEGISENPLKIDLVTTFTVIPEEKSSLELS